MLGVCIIFFRRRAAKHDHVFDFAPRSRSNSRANLRASMSNLAAKPQYKDTREFDSDFDQVDTDLSSGNGGTLRKMRQYDDVYRTHEPLKGKPEIEFPEKKLDLSEDEVMSSGSNDNRDFNTNPTNKFTYGEPAHQLGRSRQKLTKDDNNKEYNVNNPSSLGYNVPDSPDSPGSPDSPDSPTYSTATKSWARDNTVGYGHNINSPTHTAHYSPTFNTINQDVGLPRSNSRSTEV